MTSLVYNLVQGRQLASSSLLVHHLEELDGRVILSDASSRKHGGHYLSMGSGKKEWMYESEVGSGKWMDLSEWMCLLSKWEVLVVVVRGKG